MGQVHSYPQIVTAPHFQRVILALPAVIRFCHGTSWGPPLRSYAGASLSSSMTLYPTGGLSVRPGARMKEPLERGRSDMSGQREINLVLQTLRF